jgi:hypothetical protein
VGCLADKDECPADKDEYSPDKDECPADKDEYSPDKDECPAVKDEHSPVKDEYSPVKDEYRLDKAKHRLGTPKLAQKPVDLGEHQASGASPCALLRAVWCRERPKGAETAPER